MIRTKHLGLSVGWVYLHKLDDAELLDDAIDLCLLRDGPEWPSELGEEPDWFASEFAEIVDEIEEIRQFAAACRWTERESFAMAKGR